MEVIVRPTEEDAARVVARIIAAELQLNPRLVLGLATGRTMETVYRLLVEMHIRDGLDFSLCRTFNLDEYIGLSCNHPQSYRHYMHERLFRHANLDLRNTHLPDGAAPDPEAECQAYDDAIHEAGGIDLQLLGLGRTGHIGFNEPLSALMSRTRVKALSPATITQNASFFGSPDAMPRRAITMGVGTILESKRCLLLVTGEEKAEVLAKAVEGPITAMISATALQLHPRCTVIADEPAATKLQGTDYYRWIFENEPEWEPYRDL